MKTSTIFSLALVAAAHISGVSAATRVVRSPQDQTESSQKGKQSPSEFPVPGQLKPQGCFSSQGNITVKQTVANLASGSCGEVCLAKNYAVMAVRGNQCLCGTHYPPEDKLVKDSNCRFPCPYYDKEACGGVGDPGFWSVFNTGADVEATNLKKDPKDEDEDEDSSDSTSAASSSAAAKTSAAETAPAQSKTQEPEEEEDDGGSSGPNTAAIAAGVVVGVLAVGAGIGGFFFWMRRRRNAEIEEDHRRNAAVNAFINGSKPESSHGSISMTDSRLDPVMANRRLSDGSIADNQDYSRRILRVCGYFSADGKCSIANNSINRSPTHELLPLIPKSR